MSKLNNHPEERFHFPNSSALWHDGQALPESFGCRDCAFKGLCGGLQVGGGVFDCLTFCRCADPATCDNVCPRNAEHFVARSMEVCGFGLLNVASASALREVRLPLIAPMIYHKSARARAPLCSSVALSLYELFDESTGDLRFASRREMLRHFRLGRQRSIILSGTHNDRPLERWWNLADREGMVRALRRLGVSLVTTPNFSLFDDVPRHDNLFNMKRIAQAWSEIQRAGMPCAVHLNARTDRDWERWIEFLNVHPEVRYIAFEFGTGAGEKGRIDWYVGKLQKVASEVTRPLHLVMRGGLMRFAELHKVFWGVTLIDTSAFVKAQKRQRAVIVDGELDWEQSPTSAGASIDILLDTNIAALEQYIAERIGGWSERRSIAE